jgi:hypothetical protein
VADQARLAAAFDARMERVLTAYGEVAVRPIDAVAIAEASILIERRRRVRRPWTWLAAAAVIALLTMLVVAALAGGRPSVLDWLGLGPRPSPAQTQSPLLAKLQGTWMGSPRAIDTFAASAGTQLVINDGVLCITGRSYPQGCTIALSDLSVVADRKLRLVTRPGAQGRDAILGRDGACQATDVGTYTWQLSPGDDRLTILAEADGCQRRAQGIAGTWYRSVCVLRDDACLGVLEAGRYPSQFLHLKGPADAYPPSDFGAIEYEVPDGWANSSDWPVLLSLTPAADYAVETRTGPAEGTYHELDLFAHPLPVAATPTCGLQPDPAFPNPTVADFVRSLLNNDTLDVVDRGSLTVDRLAARAFDIRRVPGTERLCVSEPGLSADYMVLRDDAGGGYAPRLHDAEVHRLILVDIGGGELLAIVIDSSDPARFDDLVAASMPIVSSIVIR